MDKEYKINDPKVLLSDLIQLRDEIKEEGQQIFSHWEDQIERKAFKESDKFKSSIHQLIKKSRIPKIKNRVILVHVTF